MPFVEIPKNSIYSRVVKPTVVRPPPFAKTTMPIRAVKKIAFVPN